MELRFAISGSVVYTVQSDCVPPIGTEVVIRTESYKKGVHPGSVLRFPVSSEFPLSYDYTSGDLVVYIDVNDYEVVEEGPPID